MINLTDIKNKAGASPGGTVNLYLVPWLHVASIPEQDENGIITGNMVCRVGYKVSQFEFLPENCELENPSSGDSGSAYLKTQISVTIPKDDQVRLSLFSKMLNGLFIAILDQKSKAVKLAGSMDVPLLLESMSGKYGGQSSDIVGTTFKFVAKVFVAEYQGVIPTVPNTPVGVVLTSKVNVAINGQSTGSINITPSGGSGSYTYLWSNGATTQDLTALPAGTYSVTVKDAGDPWNKATLSIEITEPAARAKAWRVLESSAYCVKNTLEP
jgi:hypothetical protein